MNALVLAPHTDDGEFGCGGTIAWMASKGYNVYYVAFSAAEKSIPPEFPSDILRKEVREATAILGIPEKNLYILSFPVREFLVHRQAILDLMIRYQVSLKPGIVLTPSRTDTHQDHQVVSGESFRAFKKTTLLGYEIPGNTLQFTTNAFVPLTEKLLELKLSALVQYKSQVHRDCANEEFVRSLARVRGVQAGVKYAEAFEVIRWIVQ